MTLRSAAIACSAALIAALAAPAYAEAPAPQCEATSFRVYFAHGSSRLSPAAQETLDAAARAVAGCAYAELNVSIAADGPLAARRAAAIRVAADGRDWDAVRIAPRMLTEAAAGPDYADVTMATAPPPALNAATPRPQTGV